jgi:hypothetical protein
MKLTTLILFAYLVLTSWRDAEASPTVRVAGVVLPRDTATEHCTLHLNGAGLYQTGLLRVDVYVAALYAERPSTSAEELIESDQTIELWLSFKRDVSRRDLIKAARSGLRAQLGKRSGAFEQALAGLEHTLRDLREGDVTRITYDKGVGVMIAINEVSCGSVGGDEFATALFASWLGSHPMSERLKRQLLHTE